MARRGGKNLPYGGRIAGPPALQRYRLADLRLARGRPRPSVDVVQRAGFGPSAIDVFPDGLAQAITDANDGDTLVLHASTPGGTGSYAFRTITKTFAGAGLSIRVEPGDTVTIAGLQFDSPAANYKFYGNYNGPWATTARRTDRGKLIIETAGTVTSAVLVNTADNLTFDGVDLTNSRHGLRTISTDTQSAWPDGVTLVRCNISGHYVDNIQLNSGLNVLVDSCYSHDVTIDPAQALHNDGIQVTRGDGITLRNSLFTFEGSFTSGEVGPNQAIIIGRADATAVLQNVQVYNNLAYGWPGTSCILSGADNMDVFNNTFYDAGLGGSTALALSHQFGANNTFRLMNNIIESITLNSGATRPDTLETNNLVRSGGGGSNLITSDPLFTNPGISGDNYSLQALSPAKDVANTTYAPATDARGVLRGTKPDLGALELAYASDSLTDTDSTLLQNHVGELDASWTMHPNASGDAVVTSGTAKANVQNVVYAYMASASPGATDQRITWWYSLGPSTAGDYAGPIFRLDPSATSFYQLRLRNSTLELYRFNPGATLLAGPAFTMTNGATGLLVIEAFADNIVVKDASGTELINYTDATPLTTNYRFGLRGQSSQQILHDAILVEPMGAGGPVTNALAGSIASESTASGVLTVQASLAGTVASVSTVDGTLSVGVQYLLPSSSTFPSATTFPGPLSAAGGFAGTISGASAAAGALTVSAVSAGTAASASSVSGALTVGAVLAGVASSSSTVSGALSVPVPLAGAVAATSTVAGSLTALGALAVVVGSASAVSGSLTAQAGLAGTVASASTLAGAAAVRTPLAAAVASETAVSGNLFVRAALAGTISSASSADGSLTNVAPGANPLVGVVSSSSAVTGALTVRAGLAVAVTSSSSATGDLKTVAVLSATVASVSVVSGALTNTAPGSSPLAGTISSTSSVAGALHLTKPLAAAAAGTSVVAGNLTARVSVAGTTSGVSTVTGALVVSHPLLGSINATSTVTGRAVLYHGLHGAISGTSTVTGGLEFLAIRWYVTPASRWPAGSSTRWDQDPADRWPATSGGRWDTEPADRWDLVT